GSDSWAGRSLRTAVQSRQQAYRGANFGKGLQRPLRGPLRAFLKDFSNERIALFIPAPPFLNWRQMLDDCIGHPSFALDATDSGRCAALVNLRQCRLGRENLVQ